MTQFTTTPWDGSAGRWPDAASYCRSCMVDNNPAGGSKTKSECHFPIRAPGSDVVNVNALRAVVGGRGAQADFSGAQAARERAKRLLAEYQNQSERRSVELRDAEVSEMNFRGYAAVFDTPWDPRLTESAGYVETIARGAFRKALRSGQNVPLLWAHDRKELLATTAGETLRLQEDGRGLLVEASLPSTPLGESVREMIRRGDVQGMSYGMETAPGDSIVSRREGVWHRSIANIQRLLDVTLTWEPAYTATSVELRSQGFSALTLQEITAGEEEEQSGEAAAQEPPLEEEPEDLARRARAIVIREATREGRAL